jgi:hypothetical protein
VLFFCRIFILRPTITGLVALFFVEEVSMSLPELYLPDGRINPIAVWTHCRSNSAPSSESFDLRRLPSCKYPVEHEAVCKIRALAKKELQALKDECASALVGADAKTRKALAAEVRARADSIERQAAAASWSYLYLDGKRKAGVSMIQDDDGRILLPLAPDAFALPPRSLAAKREATIAKPIDLPAIFDEIAKKRKLVEEIMPLIKAGILARGKIATKKLQEKIDSRIASCAPIVEEKAKDIEASQQQFDGAAKQIQTWRKAAYLLREFDRARAPATSRRPRGDSRMVAARRLDPRECAARRQRLAQEFAHNSRARDMALTLYDTVQLEAKARRRIGKGLEKAAARLEVTTVSAFTGQKPDRKKRREAFARVGSSLATRSKYEKVGSRARRRIDARTAKKTQELCRGLQALAA